MNKFIIELLKEEYPFRTYEDSFKNFKDQLYEMRNNRTDVLKTQVLYQGGCIGDYRIENCGWYDYKNEEIHLLNYQFKDYESELWSSRGSHWSYVSGVYENMPLLRKETLELLESIRFKLSASSNANKVTIMLEALENSSIKDKFFAILEVEEFKRKLSFNKEYPLGSLQFYLNKILSHIADEKSQRSNKVFEIIKELGLNDFYHPPSLNFSMMSDEQIDEFILAHSFGLSFHKTKYLRVKYAEAINSYESEFDSLKEEFKDGLSQIINGETFNYKSSVDLVDNGWCKVSDSFQYKSDGSFVRFNGAVCKIKRKSIKPMQALIKQSKHQEGADVLLSKEELIALSGYEPSCLKEFRVLKSMFPQEPLRSLVVYDKSLGGYKLVI